jgi:hypothetical protein
VTGMALANPTATDDRVSKTIGAIDFHGARYLP